MKEFYDEVMSVIIDVERGVNDWYEVLSVYSSDNF
jgi:hypothetical protein